MFLGSGLLTVLAVGLVVAWGDLSDQKLPDHPATVHPPRRHSTECGLNGAPDKTGVCVCHPGWKGAHCSIVSLSAASPSAYGLANASTPTWGGGAVFDPQTRLWHLIVGARAIPFPDDLQTDYPCDSKIVRAVSASDDPAGPYRIVEDLVPRSSWEPGVTKAPDGSLIVLFFGNLTPPVAGSTLCTNRSHTPYNLTETNTFVMVSPSGKPEGPWTTPVLVRGMENDPSRGDPYRWSCASGNPSPAFHPNGTLFAAMRQNPCWQGYATREHIGLWRADGGWNGTWTLVDPDTPVYGWGNGSQEACGDGCPSHEDPHLWIDGEGGFHLLTHDQNNMAIHSVRGAYGWSADGVEWHLETPADSNVSAWETAVRWSNGSTAPLARRQRGSFIHDPQTGRPTHLLNGADFHHHLPQSECEGCHWGQGFTLIQPLF